MSTQSSTTAAASIPSQEAERLRLELDVFKFVLRLKLVTLDHLALDNRKCTLCRKPYAYRSLIQGPEMACRLPCGCAVGHMCIREYWSMSEMAQVSCPVCQKQIPELVEASMALTRLHPHFRQSELSGNTSGYSPDPKIIAIEEVDASKQIEQFENDTGLHFLGHNDSLESSGFEAFSADLSNRSEDATDEDRLTASDHEDESAKGQDNFKIGKTHTPGTNGSDKGRSRKRSVTWALELGRVAVKAIDIFPNKSG